MNNSRRPAISIVIISVLSGALGAIPAARVTSSTRYLDEIFSDVSVAKDLVFGEAVLPNGERLKLKLNLFEPFLFDNIISGRRRSERS